MSGASLAFMITMWAIILVTAGLSLGTILKHQK